MVFLGISKIFDKKVLNSPLPLNRLTHYLGFTDNKNQPKESVSSNLDDSYEDFISEEIVVTRYATANYIAETTVKTQEFLNLRADQHKLFALRLEEHYDCAGEHDLAVNKLLFAGSQGDIIWEINSPNEMSSYIKYEN